jgi:hypothetical protein
MVENSAQETRGFLKMDKDERDLRADRIGITPV